MPESTLAEVAGDGRLSLPADTARRMHLVPGAKFEVIAADDPLLVMRRYDSRRSGSVTEGDLLQQQQALAKVWDDPAEDIYDDDP